MTLGDVVDVTAINARDSASRAAEHANAVAGTTVIGVPFNRFQDVTVHGNDDAGVAITRVGAIDKHHARPKKRTPCLANEWHRTDAARRRMVAKRRAETPTAQLAVTQHSMKHPAKCG